MSLGSSRSGRAEAGVAVALVACLAACGGRAENRADAGVDGAGSGAGTSGAGTSGAGAAGTSAVDGSAGATGLAGTSGGAGTSGAGGTAGTSGPACLPARTTVFTREKVRNMPFQEHSIGLAARPGGSPIFIYRDGFVGDGHLNDGKILARSAVAPQTSVALSRIVQAVPEVSPPLRIAKNGEVRLAYQEYDSSRLRYVSWNGDFDRPAIDEPVGQDVAMVGNLAVALALDPQDRPGLTYSIDGGVLRYAVKTDTGWTVETIGTHGPQRMTLVYDGAGAPSLFLDDFSLVGTSRTTTGWSPITTLDPLAPESQGAEALRNAAGQIEIFFLGRGNFLRRVVGRAASWNLAAPLPVLSFPPTPSYEAAGAVDGSGRIHLFFSGTFYATFDGCEWSTQVIDPGLAPRAGKPALALDAAGSPHLSYVVEIKNPQTNEVESRDLWYAHPTPN